MSTLQYSTPQSFVIQQLAEMVASCEEFQDAAGVSSMEDALEFVSYPDYLVPTEQVRKPFAVVYHKSFKRNEIGDGTTMPSGELFLQLGKTVENFEDDKTEEILFTNFAGAIVERLHELSRDGTGRLHIIDISDFIAPRRSNRKFQNRMGAQIPFYFSEYVVAWNPIG